MFIIRWDEGLSKNKNTECVGPGYINLCPDPKRSFANSEPPCSVLKIVREGLIEYPSNAKRYGLKGVWGRSGVVGTADIVLQSHKQLSFR